MKRTIIIKLFGRHKQKKNETLNKKQEGTNKNSQMAARSK